MEHFQFAKDHKLVIEKFDTWTVRIVILQCIRILMISLTFSYIWTNLSTFFLFQLGAVLYQLELMDILLEG